MSGQQNRSARGAIFGALPEGFSSLDWLSPLPRASSCQCCLPPCTFFAGRLPFLIQCAGYLWWSFRDLSF